MIGPSGKHQPRAHTAFKVGQSRSSQSEREFILGEHLDAELLGSFGWLIDLLARLVEAVSGAGSTAGHPHPATIGPPKS